MPPPSSKNTTILIDTSVRSIGASATVANSNDINSLEVSSSDAKMQSASEIANGESGQDGRRSAAPASTALLANGVDAQQQAREQRRRERRERRQPRGSRQSHCHASTTAPSMHSPLSNSEILPDVLHNHIPPPYTTLPMPMPTHCQLNTSAAVLTQSPPSTVLVPGPPAALIPAIGFGDDARYTFPLPIIRR